MNAVRTRVLDNIKTYTDEKKDLIVFTIGADYFTYDYETDTELEADFEEVEVVVEVVFHTVGSPVGKGDHTKTGAGSSCDKAGIVIVSGNKGCISSYNGELACVHIIRGYPFDISSDISGLGSICRCHDCHHVHHKNKSNKKCCEFFHS